VGASTKTDDIAPFSSRGPVVWNEMALMKPDLVAPGVSICAARYGSYGSSPCRSGTHVSLSGTSMATPHVAGAAALLLEAAPGLTPDQVKSTMKGSAVLTQGSAVSWGAGRLDIAAAVRQGATPPVARLDAIAATGGTRPITGTAWASAWGEWKLELAAYRGASLPEQGWALLTSATATPEHGFLTQLPNAVLEGRYILRLTVTDAAGRRAIDHAYVEVDKLRIISPLDRDVLRGGDVVELRGFDDGSLSQSTYNYEYQPYGSTAGWTPIASGQSPTVGWETQGIPAGFYSIRMTVAHDGVVEAEIVRVTLDPTLRSGAPIRVAHVAGDGCHPCSNWPGWVDPIVDDLDGDGTSELLYMWHAGVPELRVQTLDGVSLWEAPLGTTAAPSTNLAFNHLHLPVVADADGDGEKEIYAFNIYDSRMYVVSAAGEIIRSFGVSVAWGDELFLPRLSMSDVDADGRPDLILSLKAYSYALGSKAKVVIVTTTGHQLADWFVSSESSPWRIYLPGYNYAPATIDIDEDPDLEVIAVDFAGGKIRAFDWDGTELTGSSPQQGPLCGTTGSLGGGTGCDSLRTDPVGWPVTIDDGSFDHFPVLTGDLDGDADSEIVAGAVWGDASNLQLFVLDEEGNSLPGWPLTSQMDTNAGPSLADLDGDADLELILPAGLRTHAFHHDGTSVAGWPAVMRGVSYRQAVIADITGDGSVDVVVNTSSAVKGLLEAWSSTGTPIAGFPKPLERDDHSSVVIAPLARGGPVSIVASSSSDWEQTTGRSKNRSTIYVWELAGAFDPGASPWPTFQHDLARTARA